MPNKHEPAADTVINCKKCGKTHETEFYTHGGVTFYECEPAADAVRDRATELESRLLQEAQIHAQEARCANSIVNEIYQLCTGATGEPGNWNGAEPVRQLIEKHAAELAQARAEIDGLKVEIETLTQFNRNMAAALEADAEGGTR